jgi:hypothetical protein
MKYSNICCTAVPAGGPGGIVRTKAHRGVKMSPNRYLPDIFRIIRHAGVLIIEALAQAAAILTFKTHDHKADDNSVYYFVGIDKARFKKPVLPGDTLELNVEVKRFARGIWWFSAVARVADRVVTEADLMCTLRAIDSNKACKPDNSKQPQ